MVHRWSLHDKSPVSLNQVLDPGGVFAFAAKWYGSRKVEFYSDFHDGHSTMVEHAHRLIDEADVLIHFNGSAFDLPHLRREILLHPTLGVPSPVQEVDLLLVARKRFRFLSNKLEHLAQQLGLGGKVQHAGHMLWRQCLDGDAKAWAQMKRYNIGDVRLTEQVYDRFLPWIHNHPHMGLYTGEAHSCANCGSGQLQRRGFKATALSTYQQYQCQGCGAWSRGKTAIARVDERGTA